MYKLVKNSNMPNYLKFLINALLTITCVYWIGYFTFKILDTIRKFIHWVSEARNWWTFLICILILGIGILLAAQFYFDLDPVGKTIDKIVEWFKNFRNDLANIIGG